METAVESEVAKVTLKSLFGKIGKALGVGAKSVIKMVADADLLTLCKFGVVVGVAVITVRFILKYLKNRKHVYTNEENKSIVDRALEINYADRRNQHELHPLMKKVRKNLKGGMDKDKRAKYREKLRNGKGKFQGYMEKERHKRFRDYLPRLLTDMKEFAEFDNADETMYGCDLADWWRYNTIS